MTLNDTIEMMQSSDYKERFKAQYYQLKIRICKLDNMLNAWDRDELTFELTCPRAIYELQLRAMREYKSFLEIRAAIEGIELDISLSAC